MLQPTQRWMQQQQRTMPWVSAPQASDGVPGQVRAGSCCCSGCINASITSPAIFFACLQLWQLEFCHVCHNPCNTLCVNIWLCLLVFAGAGMASGDLVKAKIASLGMFLLQPAAGLAALERLLAAPTLPTTGAALTSTQLSLLPQAVVDVVPFNWPRMLQRHQQLPHVFQVVAEGLMSSSTSSSAAASGAVSRQQRHQQHSAVVPAVPDQERLLGSIRATVHDVLGREVSS